MLAADGLLDSPPVPHSKEENIHWLVSILGGVAARRAAHLAVPIIVGALLGAGLVRQADVNKWCASLSKHLPRESSGESQPPLTSNPSRHAAPGSDR